MPFLDAIDPGPRRRVALVGVLLAVSLACVGLLVHQAYQASRAHREATERAFDETVQFAAWGYAGAVRRAVGSHLVDHVLEEMEAAGVPDDSAALSRLGEDLGSGPLHFGEVAFRFRRPLDGSGARIAGDAPRAAARFVADSLVGAPYDARWHHGAVMLEKDSTLLVWRFHPKTAAEPEVAIGFGVALGAVRPLFEESFEQVELLPPGRAGGRTNADLFGVRVRSPGGALVFEGGAATDPAMAVRAADTVGSGFGGFVVALAADRGTAGLVPGAAPPPWRWPLLVGLSALVAALIAAAALLVRREHQLARARADFVSSVTHALRTPLAQIRLWGETLALGRARSDAERERALRVIVQEADRLDRMVDDVLAFVRSGAADRPPERRATDLARLAAETVDGFRPLAEPRGTRLDVVGEAEAVAEVDPTAMRKALSNLIDNALKYGPPEQTVTVGVLRANGRVRIAVEDEGPGVPAESRDRVWRPFERLEAHRATGGTGIGLAVVQRIAADHGGTAGVEEGTGGGARFVLEFPTASRSAPERDGTGGPADPDAPFGAGRER